METLTRERAERLVVATFRELPGMREKDITLGTSYTDDLGLDSIDTVEIAGELEGCLSNYGFRGFDNNDVGHLNTVRKTVDYIMDNVRKA